MSAPAFKADVEEGDSPRLLSADAPTANGGAEKAHAIPPAALESSGESSSGSENGKQEEDKDIDREGGHLR